MVRPRGLRWFWERIRFALSLRRARQRNERVMAAWEKAHERRYDAAFPEEDRRG